jgi:hypothetical protein
MSQTLKSAKSKFWICILVFVLCNLFAQISYPLIDLAISSEFKFPNPQRPPEGYEVAFCVCYWLLVNFKPKFKVITNAVILGGLLPTIGLAISFTIDWLGVFELPSQSRLAMVLSTFIFSWVFAGFCLSVNVVYKKLRRSEG